MKYPKQIFVKWEIPTSDQDDPWLVAQDSTLGLVEADEVVTCAVYKLERMIKVSAKTKIEG